MYLGRGALNVSLVINNSLWAYLNLCPYVTVMITSSTMAFEYFSMISRLLVGCFTLLNIMDHTVPLSSEIYKEFLSYDVLFFVICESLRILFSCLQPSLSSPISFFQPFDMSQASGFHRSNIKCIVPPMIIWSIKFYYSDV